MGLQPEKAVEERTSQRRKHRPRPWRLPIESRGLPYRCPPAGRGENSGEQRHHRNHRPHRRKRALNADDDAGPGVGQSLDDGDRLDGIDPAIAKYGKAPRGRRQLGPARTSVDHLCQRPGARIVRTTWIEIDHECGLRSSGRQSQRRHHRQNRVHFGPNPDYHPVNVRGDEADSYLLPGRWTHGITGGFRTIPGEMSAAAFFDLDKTIIAKSSTLAFSRPLFRAGLLNRSALAKAGIAQAYYQLFGADHDQLERIREELSGLIKGWDRREIERLVAETVDEVVTPLVYEEALALIDEHQRSGRKVVVISSSPVEIVKPLCTYLGIDNVIGTRPELDDEGRYTGNIDFYAYGPGKVEAMMELAGSEGISLTDSFAYSDSATDLPMLEAVGHPVAVNPDRELREVALQRDWQVLEFRRPVTLRARLASIPKPVPMISGAAVATGVAAALTVWALKSRRARG